MCVRVCLYGVTHRCMQNTIQCKRSLEEGICVVYFQQRGVSADSCLPIASARLMPPYGLPRGWMNLAKFGGGPPDRGGHDLFPIFL